MSVTGTFGVGSRERKSTVPHLRVIGPGRAGTSLAGALRHHGWDLHPFIARGDDVAGAANGTDVLVIATPDDVISNVAASIKPDADTLVVHLAGSLGADVLGDHPKRAALHPLMTFPDTDTGVARMLDRPAIAVDGHREVEALASILTDTVLHIGADDRARYHAAAAVASNHLVALAGHVEAVAGPIGVPLDAYLDLMVASLDNVRRFGVQGGLTGPAARGDIETLQRHLVALDPAERDLYAVLAERAAQIAGVDLDMAALIAAAS